MNCWARGSESQWPQESHSGCWSWAQGLALDSESHWARAQKSHSGCRMAVAVQLVRVVALFSHPYRISSCYFGLNSNPSQPRYRVCCKQLVVQPIFLVFVLFENSQLTERALSAISRLFFSFNYPHFQPLKCCMIYIAPTGFEPVSKPQGGTLAFQMSPLQFYVTPDSPLLDCLAPTGFEPVSPGIIELLCFPGIA